MVHPDSRTVADEIMARRAVVVLTDGVEVELQTQQHPEVCGTTAPLTRAEKTVLLPLRSDLAPRVANGQIGERPAQAVGEAMQ